MASKTDTSTAGRSDPAKVADWTALRQSALKCLGAALDLVSFAEHAKAGYDAAYAAMHLRVIRNATETLVDAVPRMGRWHFDCLALASVGEGPRPDFHFGEVSCATAHETAFRLLHAADTKLTEQLRAALRETGLDAKVNVNNLERLSPQELRETLIRAARSGPLISLDPQGLHLVKSWIDREWAAVSRPPPDDPVHPEPEGKGVSLLDAALILTEEDRSLSIQKKKSWQKLRTPNLPASIGNCPNHKQVKLFVPSAIADFVEKVEGKTLCTQYKLRQRLNAKAREPRQE